MESDDYENSFEQLMGKLHTFRKTHKQLILPKRKALIEKLYNDLQLELDGEAEISFRTNEQHSAHIMLTAKSFLACDEAHTLSTLIGLSNFFQVQVHNDSIKMSLWFRFWDWQ